MMNAECPTHLKDIERKKEPGSSSLLALLAIFARIFIICYGWWRSSRSKSGTDVSLRSPLPVKVLAVAYIDDDGVACRTPESGGADMKKKLFLEKSLPMYLFGLLVVAMLLTVFTQANAYGLTTDEAMHDSYGQSVLKWYVTLGRDRGFLNYPLEDYEPEHGAIFDVVVALAQHFFHHQWQTEAIITGLTGVLGVLALALCGFELGGWWFAFLAALSLWLYPRFFGAIFNNPKDIPFTMANTFVLWSVLRLLKHWDKEKSLARASLPVAFFLAIAIAIRANAVVWYALLGLLLAGWWLLNWQRARKEKKLVLTIKRQALIGGIIGMGSFLGTLLLWPYVFLNPLANFYNALVVIARYPWNGSVLYQGKMQLAADLPRSYAPVWLVIGSPPALLLFAGIGLLICGDWYARKRTLDARLALVILAFVLPLSLIVGLHSVVYNGLRQFLFLVPPLILLAVYGMLNALAFLWRRKQIILIAALVLCIGASYAWTIKDMLAIHPYEYAYFSPLVGGIAGANGQYEIDYWNTCQKAASTWLGAHYQAFTSSQQPTIQEKPIKFQYLTYLPANFQTAAGEPDFLIDIPPFSPARDLARYQLIHAESVQGVPLCRVYANRNTR